jgi:hypothetical protein
MLHLQSLEALFGTVATTQLGQMQPGKTLRSCTCTQHWCLSSAASSSSVPQATVACPCARLWR